MRPILKTLKAVSTHRQQRFYAHTVRPNLLRVAVLKADTPQHLSATAHHLTVSAHTNEVMVLGTTWGVRPVSDNRLAHVTAPVGANGMPGH